MAFLVAALPPMESTDSPCWFKLPQRGALRRCALNRRSRFTYPAHHFWLAGWVAAVTVEVFCCMQSLSGCNVTTVAIYASTTCA